MQDRLENTDPWWNDSRLSLISLKALAAKASARWYSRFFRAPHGDAALMQDRLEHAVPVWSYSHLSSAMLEFLAAKAPGRVKCLCAEGVTVVKMSASGADDGPTYGYCETCYRAALKKDQDEEIPVAVEDRFIGFYDIVW